MVTKRITKKDNRNKKRGQQSSTRTWCAARAMVSQPEAATVREIHVATCPDRARHVGTPSDMNFAISWRYGRKDTAPLRRRSGQNCESEKNIYMTHNKKQKIRVYTSCTFSFNFRFGGM